MRGLAPHGRRDARRVLGQADGRGAERHLEARGERDVAEHGQQRKDAAQELDGVAPCRYLAPALRRGRFPRHTLRLPGVRSELAPQLALPLAERGYEGVDLALAAPLAQHSLPFRRRARSAELPSAC